MQTTKGKFPFVAEIVALYTADRSAREVAQQWGVSKSHVLRVVHKAGIVRSQAVAQHLAAKKRRQAEKMNESTSSVLAEQAV